MDLVLHCNWLIIVSGSAAMLHSSAVLTAVLDLSTRTETRRDAGERPSPCTELSEQATFSLEISSPSTTIAIASGSP